MVMDVSNDPAAINSVHEFQFCWTAPTKSATYTAQLAVPQDMNTHAQFQPQNRTVEPNAT
jgi:hypothetical protein